MKQLINNTSIIIIKMKYSKVLLAKKKTKIERIMNYIILSYLLLLREFITHNIVECSLY